MPAQLLGPNYGGSSVTHPQIDTRTYISSDSNQITPYSPLVYTSSDGVTVQLGSTTPGAGVNAGIATSYAIKGKMFEAIVAGVTKCKVTGTPAVGTAMQLDAVAGATLVAFTTGQQIGILVGAVVGGLGLVDIRLT
jgi:hypothetical protein